MEPNQAKELAKLSPRRLETLQLMAQGLSETDMARSMGLALGSVIGHVSMTCRLIGIPKRSTRDEKWQGAAKIWQEWISLSSEDKTRLIQEAKVDKNAYSKRSFTSPLEANTTAKLDDPESIIGLPVGITLEHPHAEDRARELQVAGYAPEIINEYISLDDERVITRVIFVKRRKKQSALR